MLATNYAPTARPTQLSQRCGRIPTFSVVAIFAMVPVAESPPHRARFGWTIFTVRSLMSCLNSNQLSCASSAAIEVFTVRMTSRYPESFSDGIGSAIHVILKWQITGYLGFLLHCIGVKLSVERGSAVYFDHAPRPPDAGFYNLDRHSATDHVCSPWGNACA